MYKIAVLNTKGGVGKTTCVLNIACSLARAGKKVLCIDSDPQASLTAAFGFNGDDLENTLPVYLEKHINKEQVDLKDFILETSEGVYLFPSDIRLTNIDRILGNMVARELFYKKAFKELDSLDIDFLIIDSPPYTSLIVNNILAYAEYVLIPVSPDFLTLKAFSTVAETIEMIKEDVNPQLEILGIIFNLLDSRTLDGREVMDYTRETLGKDTYIFKSTVRNNVKVKEAQTAGKSVFAYSNKAIAALDFEKVTKELLKVIRNNA